MKKLILSALTVCMTFIAFSQSKQYVLFEHFTQASCPPCATQNPIFEGVVGENEGKYHHIAYHTSWPGFDPMHDLNPADVQQRVNYYNVSGVPDMNMLGSTWNGGPAGVTSDQIDAAASNSAPIRIKVTDELVMDSTHQVTVEIIETGDLTGTDLRLRVSVQEALIDYGTAPGTNGEVIFPNVFRKMLPDTDGELVTPTGAGTSQTFTFTYVELPEYNMDEIYVVAFLQDDATDVVVNSGATTDPTWETVNTSASTFQGGAGPHGFYSDLITEGVDEEVNITLTTDAPADWLGTISVDGVDFTDVDITVDVPAGGLEYGVEIAPGTTAGIGNYTLTVTSLTYPDDPAASVTYTVISGITDLVVDHGGVATQWNVDYQSGLADAGNETFATLSINKFLEGMENGQLDEVINVYDNVSWTFPGFIEAETNVLATFLDNGGNLFVNGQDLGWDTWENEGTAVTQAFYTDYLSVTFDNDGSGANSLYTPAGEVLYGDLDNSAVIDVYGGNIYPDVFTPIDPAVAILNYNNNDDLVGATRVHENGHKIVYVGVDMGMIADEDVRHAIIEISHDWFYGVISSLEFDMLISEALGQSYPNPAVTTTVIPLSDLSVAADITVVDIDGHTVHQGRVAAGQVNYELNVEQLSAGSYLYYLTTEEGRSESMKLQVSK